MSKRLSLSILLLTLISTTTVISPSQAQIPLRKGAIANCGRVVDDWSPEESTDPATLIDQYLSDYDLETSSGVDAAIEFVHGQMQSMQSKLDGLKELSPRALQQEGGRATMRELDTAIQQVSVLAVILKNAKSSFLGRRVEN